MVTRNYNESMKRLLPAYGVQVIEIARRKSGGIAISATRVRDLLQDKKYEEIKKLVPESTFNYLQEQYVDKGRVQDCKR